MTETILAGVLGVAIGMFITTQRCHHVCRQLAQRLTNRHGHMITALTKGIVDEATLNGRDWKAELQAISQQMVKHGIRMQLVFHEEPETTDGKHANDSKDQG